jgi:hypothetical protein
MTLIKIILLVISVFGLILQYKYSPKIEYQIYSYNDNEMPEVIKKQKHQNLLYKIGYYLTLSSLILSQLISLCN